MEIRQGGETSTQRGEEAKGDERRVGTEWAKPEGGEESGRKGPEAGHAGVPRPGERLPALEAVGRGGWRQLGPAE